MTTYVTLLRGINAGVTVKMADLGQIFEHLGLRQVRTVLATGNVLFESDETDPAHLEQRIEAALAAKLNYATTAIVWTLTDLQQLVRSNPFKHVTITPTTVPQVSFLKSAAKPASKLPAGGTGYKVVSVQERVVCSVVDLSGATTPDLLRLLDRAYGKSITTRNWKTVQKIAQSKPVMG